VPLDIWVAISLWLVWLVVLTFAVSLSCGIAWTFMVFGLPLLLIWGSDTLSFVSFWRAPLQESGPGAFRIFAWAYMIGFQIWLIYWLTHIGPS
jgi:hypothetical protein